MVQVEIIFGKINIERMRRFKKKKGTIRSKKITVDGIKFASGLEAYTYRALKKAKIKAQYEGETFVLQEGFNFTSVCYERQANSKGEFKDRGNKKILPIKYTPDFTGKGFIIETKGFANQSFPLRYKLFKKWIEENRPGTVLYKPQCQKEVDMMIELIKTQIK